MENCNNVGGKYNHCIVVLMRPMVLMKLVIFIILMRLMVPIILMVLIKLIVIVVILILTWPRVWPSLSTVTRYDT